MAKKDKTTKIAATAMVILSLMIVSTISRIRTTKKLFVRGFTYHPVKSSLSSSSSLIFQTEGFCWVSSNKKPHQLQQKYHHRRWSPPTLYCSRSENENEGSSSSSAEEKDYNNNNNDDNRALVRDVVESILQKTSPIATATTATRTSSSSPPPSPPKNNNNTNNVNNEDVDIVVPFQRLFQSTLQRAYSTTTTAAAAATTRTSSSSVATTTTTTTPIIIPPTVSTSNNSTNNSRHSSSSSLSSTVLINETNQKEESSFPASTSSSSSLSEQNQNDPPSPPLPAKQQQQQQSSYSYRSNPAFQTIALAHLLWGTIIRPNVDTVIDATCGQGYDSIKLAELLFLSNNSNNNDNNGNDTSTTSTTTTTSTCQSELLCLDIQSLACEKTSHALREVLPSSIGISSVTNSNNSNNNNNNNNMDCSSKDTDDEDVTNNKVRIIETSHEILPRPRNISSVGLIVYNLGWLPGVVGSSVDANKDDNNNKDCVTTTETTISSLVDATSMIRNGGMISIATYPATNVEEDSAVKLFVTCLALLTSNIRTWEEEIISFVKTTSTATSTATATGTTSEEDDGNNDNNNDDNDNNLLAIRENDIALVVYRAMEKIVDQRKYSKNSKSTWRVAQHEKLGMDCAPILYTATRIK